METDEQSLITLFENAEKMYKEGKLEESISEFGKIIELAPKNQLAAKASNSIGDIYFDKEVDLKAADYYKKAIEIDPNFLTAYKNLGLTYYCLNNYNEALEQYKKVIDSNPDIELKIECLISIGNIYTLKGDYTQALNKFNEAKELDTTLDDANFQIAKCLSDNLKFEEALDQYKKTIELYPDSELAAKAYLEIGNIYSNDDFEKTDLTEAEKNYRDAIKINHKSNIAADAFNGIGEIYLYKKKYDIAIDNFKSAININPNSEDAHYNLADSLEEMKMHKEALLEIDEAIRINPNISDYYNLKGNICWRRQYPKAIEAYEKAMKIEPTDYWPYDNLARLHEIKKQKEKAIEMWIKCLRYADLDEEGRNKSGKVKKHLNKLGVTEKEIEMIKSKILDSPPEPDKIKETQENPPQDSGFLMEILIKNTFLPYNFYMKITDLLEEKPQLIFYGVPGTGKTFVAKEFAKYFTNCASEADLKNQFQLIQFHQSYSYEEFIEGIRPEPLPDNKGMSYPIKSGIFKTFCEEADKNRDKKYLLIIDEINRGNISKIFGELLFLLEYRDEKITLPYSKKPFSIPDNVYIIGTMNTADRSIAFVDYALRRRFNFIEFLPNKEVLEKWLNENPDKRSGIDVLNIFTKLNDTIKNDLDEHHQIGHSYFMIEIGILDEKRLKLIWDYNIMPLLKEYFFTKTNLDKYSFDSMIKG